MGFAREAITPPGAMPMAGYDGRSGLATGTLDDLYVSALALTADDGTPFVLCSFDLLGTDRTLCTQARQAIAAQYSIAEDNIWISATHTHSAPSGIFFGRANYCAQYAAMLCERGCAAAGKALRAARDAAAAAAAFAVADVASLRDRPRAQSAYQMPVLLIRFAGETQRATLCRFACHATVLDEKNTLYSRDLPGAVESALQETANCLFLNGACADLSTRYTRGGSNPAELARLGHRMAAAIEKAHLEDCGGFARRISAVRQTAHIARGASLPEEERQRLLEILRSKKQDSADAAARREIDAKIAVLERPAAAAEPDRAVDVSAVDFGPLILLGLSFEVSSSDGRRIEAALSARAKKPVFAVCYTGGYDGYLPSGAPLRADSSYQDFASRYAPQTREQLLQCAGRCIDSLAKQDDAEYRRGERL